MTFPLGYEPTDEEWQQIVAGAMDDDAKASSCAVKLEHRGIMPFKTDSVDVALREFYVWICANFPYDTQYPDTDFLRRYKQRKNYILVVTSGIHAKTDTLRRVCQQLLVRAVLERRRLMASPQELKEQLQLIMDGLPYDTVRTVGNVVLMWIKQNINSQPRPKRVCARKPQGWFFG